MTLSMTTWPVAMIAELTRLIRNTDKYLIKNLVCAYNVNIVGKYTSQLTVYISDLVIC